MKARAVQCIHHGICLRGGCSVWQNFNRQVMQQGKIGDGIGRFRLALGQKQLHRPAQLGGNAGHDKTIPAVVALASHHQQPHRAGQAAQLGKGSAACIFHHLDVQKAVFVGGVFQRFHLSSGYRFVVHGAFLLLGHTCIIA